MDLPAATETQLARLLRSDVAAAQKVQRGYTPAERWVVTLADGRSAFVKQAVDSTVVPRLRREHAVYQQLRGPWRPEVLAFEDGPAPLLVLEDLSECSWPPPWSDGQVAAVRRALADVAAQPAPADLRRAVDTGFAEDGWPEVARDPRPFLSVGLCSERWLQDALPALLAAADSRLIGGDSICHLDVRSDNLCFRPDGQASLIDWDCAAIGNPEYDLAFWLPSLRLEGGPPPSSVAAITPGVTALVAGFFACEAGLPQIPTAPHVRDIQQRQLAVALPWAADALGLPRPIPPDEPPERLRTAERESFAALAVPRVREVTGCPAEARPGTSASARLRLPLARTRSRPVSLLLSAARLGERQR